MTAGTLLGAAEALGTRHVNFTARRPGSPTTLDYRRSDEAIVDVVDARVWLGVHFRTADVRSMVLGRKVAHRLGRQCFREAARRLRHGSTARPP